MRNRMTPWVLAFLVCGGMLYGCGGDSETTPDNQTVLTLTSVHPASGPDTGGTTITLTGTGFTPGATVMVGGAAATGVTYVNATTLTCVTPAWTPNRVSISVTTSAGTQTLVNAFEYYRSPSETDLTGWWEMKIRRTGTLDSFVRVTLAQMQQTGDTLLSEDNVWTIDGSSIHEADPNDTAPNRDVMDLTVVNANLIEGTITTYLNDVVFIGLDVRFERTTAPAGTLTASGEVVNVNVGTGFAELQLEPAWDTFYLTIADSQPTSYLDIEIEFDGFDPYMTGGYSIPMVPNSIYVSVSTGSSYESASTGSLTLHEFTTQHVRGEGNFTLDSGEIFTFSFDVDIVATYDMDEIMD